MRFVFAIFWGLLAVSAIGQLVDNVGARRWGYVAGGLFVLAWTGGNAYLWVRKARPH